MKRGEWVSVFRGEGERLCKIYHSVNPSSFEIFFGYRRLFERITRDSPNGKRGKCLEKMIAFLSQREMFQESRQDRLAVLTFSFF